LSAGKIWQRVPARTSVPDAVPPGGGGAGVVLTGVGFAVGGAVGFALADLLGVGVAEALLGDDVAEADAPAAPAPDAALEDAALEMGALEAALDTTAEADEAAPLALPGALGRGPFGAAWW
jgi:hypothetical protein